VSAIGHDRFHVRASIRKRGADRGSVVPENIVMASTARPMTGVRFSCVEKMGGRSIMEMAPGIADAVPSPRAPA